MAVGMPEARSLLSEAALAIATSPKSNSAIVAVDKASDDVANRRTGEVPMHLRNAPVDGMADLGYGKGYKYAHSYPGNIVDQEFLPEEIRGFGHIKAAAMARMAPRREGLLARLGPEGSAASRAA